MRHSAFVPARGGRAPRPAVRGFRPFVRFAVVGALLVAGGGGGGCAHRAPRLEVTSPAAAQRLAGRFSGEVLLGEEVITLRLDSAVVEFVASGTSGDVGVVLEDVTVRAVLAVDSAGHPIPVGASSPVDVARSLQPGEGRTLRTVEFALPVPLDVRLSEVWVAFQMGGTLRVGDAPPSALVGYACSPTNLARGSVTARQRADRLRARYDEACHM